MNTSTTIEADRLLRANEVCSACGFSRTFLYKAMAAHSWEGDRLFLRMVTTCSGSW